MLQVFPAFDMAVFDEEPSKKRYSGGNFLSINLKKTNLAPVLEAKPMIMVGSHFQPAIPPCNQPPYAEDDLCEDVDSLTFVTREIAATPQSLRNHRRGNCFLIKWYLCIQKNFHIRSKRCPKSALKVLLSYCMLPNFQVIQWFPSRRHSLPDVTTASYCFRMEPYRKKVRYPLFRSQALAAV